MEADLVEFGLKVMIRWLRKGLSLTRLGVCCKEMRIGRPRQRSLRLCLHLQDLRVETTARKGLAIEAGAVRREQAMERRQHHRPLRKHRQAAAYKSLGNFGRRNGSDTAGAFEGKGSC